MSIIITEGSMVGDAIVASRKAFAELDEAKIESADSTLELDFDEWFRFQRLQAQEFAMERIGFEDAQTLHAALGESRNSYNGGWADGVDTATKYACTLVFQKLLQRRVRDRL